MYRDLVREEDSRSCSSSERSQRLPHQLSSRSEAGVKAAQRRGTRAALTPRPSGDYSVLGSYAGANIARQPWRLLGRRRAVPCRVPGAVLTRRPTGDESIRGSRDNANTVLCPRRLLAAQCRGPRAALTRTSHDHLVRVPAIWSSELSFERHHYIRS